MAVLVQIVASLLVAVAVGQTSSSTSSTSSSSDPFDFSSISDSLQKSACSLTGNLMPGCSSSSTSKTTGLSSDSCTSNPDKCCTSAEKCSSTNPFAGCSSDLGTTTCVGSDMFSSSPVGVCMCSSSSESCTSGTCSESTGFGVSTLTSGSFSRLNEKVHMEEKDEHDYTKAIVAHYVMMTGLLGGFVTMFVLIRRGIRRAFSPEASDVELLAGDEEELIAE
eukprot:CAMPEP_0197620980 /NCGR_PEP_ID=MMETSP1338-20131121/1654_1 /TAXON_ID=43686 ORGANISM="Pelagodinium beii, Strain RCC1491" /NCGR_SAMPLE_ID=MMETSP1338 /ASSEMBLY_ACC=CAM_ASM_000754 /LENGTH=220 /DNA_ID=CAMNT_0043190297 /DNA_START=81 /DNA_END=743 /DNA_ORIENTATION=-